MFPIFLSRKKKSFFKSKKTFAKEILAEARLNIERLNADQDIDHPMTRSFLKKQFASFEDELCSTFAGLLYVSKRVSELKALDFEIEPWYQMQLDATSELTFSTFNYLTNEETETVSEFIKQFYHEKEADDKVYDFRDKLREEREVSLL